MDESHILYSPLIDADANAIFERQWRFTDANRVRSLFRVVVNPDGTTRLI